MLKKRSILHIYLFFLCLVAFQNVLFAQDETVPQDNPLYQEVLAITDKVEKENLIAGNFPSESTASLPFGIAKTIAGTSYVIAIDNAVFKTNEATCSAYMAINLPGAMDKIAFAAKNIGINPKGVMSTNNSRLVLVSDHRIRISKNVVLVLKNDGSNYIEWDCNGFKTVNLKGYFEFSNTILIPDPEAGVAGDKVTASFEIHASDIHNFITQVSITPFCLRGLKDVAFSVTDATVDLSELANATGMTFPIGYQNSSPDVNMWTGFYLKQFTVKLPKELSKKNAGRTTLSATNMVIDNTGISGLFAATNVLALGSADMQAWQFSVDKLSVNIAQNHLNGGSLAGTLKLPLFENNALVYDAALQENQSTKEIDYQFTVKPQNNLKATVLSASIDLYPSSEITLKKANGKFTPRASLTGLIKLEANAASTGKLDFQDVVVTAESPYLISGTFGFTTAAAGENKIGKFPITINKIGLSFDQKAASLYFQVGINFMKAEDKGFAATAGFRVLTKFVTGANPSDIKWKFDRVRVEDITLDIRTQAFTLKGYVNFRENDPVYGNGFAGGINLGITSINLDVKINVIFGAKDTYKYFYVDGMVALPTPVVVGTGVALYRFMGGMYYHMKQPEGNAGKLYTSAFGSNTPPNYIPDEGTGLGFKAGVTLGMVGKEDAFNADVALEVRFNSATNGGGIAEIKFTGDCFLMTSIKDREGKTYKDVPVGAFIYIGYDFNKPEFHAILNIAINLNSVQGQINSVFHVDKKVWYVYIGTPSQRGYLNVADLATVNSYFMVGNKIEPMPDLPPQIAANFGKPNNRDTQALESAKGFAFGATISIGTYKEFDLSIFTAYGGVNFITGFDLMMQKYPSYFTCPNTGTNPGFKGWYLKGQLYAYLNASVGVKGSVGISKRIRKNFDQNVFSGSATAVLYGELIKPSYVEGRIACSYSILKVLKGNFNFNFEKGTRCGA